MLVVSGAAGKKKTYWFRKYWVESNRFVRVVEYGGRNHEGICGKGRSAMWRPLSRCNLLIKITRNKGWRSRNGTVQRWWLL